ncbi:MAG: hypothetical protein NC213_00190 [Acetobacter sp.]|nr:hypothetical protein [Bacteroides sp.]MCM1340144.1 hypothetical protein [Acetobacter sp.]MCM1432726.1 hypothetical protein [Clostridiales bacterium]
MSKTKFDWSFGAFLEACAEVDMSSTANQIRRQKQTKKIAKYRKKQNKRKNRQTAALIVAHHYNKKLNRFVFGNKRK